MPSDFRTWYRGSFRKNEEYLRSIADGSCIPKIDNDKASVGLICLKMVAHGVTASAAGETAIAEHVLKNAAELLSKATALYGSRQERDEYSLDRPSIAVAAGAGAVLQPSSPWPQYAVPYEAFRRFLELDVDDEDEKAIAILVWVINATRDNLSSELAAAAKWKCRSRELRAELGFARDLAAEGLTPGNSRTIESLFQKWADPTLSTDGFGANYRLLVLFSLLWLWAKRQDSSDLPSLAMLKLLEP